MEAVKSRFSDTLTTAQVRDEYGLNEGTLRFWRHAGIGPRSFRVGPKSVRYRREDVEAWLEEQYEAAQ